MSYLATFLHDVFEEKYAINPYFSFGHSKDGGWHLGSEYTGESRPMGYKANNVMRYIKIKQTDAVLHQEEIGIEFQVGNDVRINNEIIEIVNVVRNLDGSIDYYTNKKVFIPINTSETYFDERE